MPAVDSTGQAGSTRLQAQSTSASYFDGEPIGNGVWASESDDAFYYLMEADSGEGSHRYSTRTGVYRFDLAKGSSELIYTLPTNADYWYSGDELYTMARLSDATSSEAEFDVSRIDLAGSRTPEPLMTLDLGANYFSDFGVDSSGRVFVLTSDMFVRVYSRTGQFIGASTDRATGSFVGFDGANGNFYLSSVDNWVYWGYDHDMSCLKMGNVSNDGVVALNDNVITYFYQKYWFEHDGNAEMLGGRYLADLSNFNDDYLAVIDSRKVSVTDVGRAETSIDLTTGGVNVTGVALPSETIALYAKTFDSDYVDDRDVTSVGTRCAYLADRNAVLVATGSRQVTLYDLSSGSAQGTIDCSHDVYKLMATNGKMVALEKDGDGLVVETLPLTFPTRVTLEGPSSIAAGSSADYRIGSDGAVSVGFSVKSSDPSVVSIDAAGRASAWRPGTATITCTTATGLVASNTVTVTAAVRQRTFAAITPLSGATAYNRNAHVYRVWSAPVASSLVETPQGLMRVQARSGDVLVEYYGTDGKVTSSRTVEFPLPLYGGFFADESGYYLAFGQENMQESDSVVVMRVVRYDTSWTPLGSLDVSGANTYIPFDAGSLRMDSADGKLYIHTCHEMYMSDDGLHHQANMTYVVSTADMSLADSFYSVMNLSSGYVSHSFNQFVKVKDGAVYRVDHGDAYPRGIAITITPVENLISNTTGTGTVASFEGATGANYTGASVGGFELSDSHALIAWNHDAIYNDSSVRNVTVSSVDLESGQIATHEITAYDATGKQSCTTPQLVKIDGRHFLLMWVESIGESGSVVKLAQIDQTGQLVGSPVEKKLMLSDCQPIVLSDGTIAWYASSNDAVRLYTLDPLDLAGMPDDPEADEATGGDGGRESGYGSGRSSGYDNDIDDDDDDEDISSKRSIKNCSVCFGRIGPVRYAEDRERLLVVRDGAKTLKLGEDYYVSASSASGIGFGEGTTSYLTRYTATIKGSGAYKGTIQADLAPIANKTAIKSAKRSGKAIKVKWREERGAAGYRIYRAVGKGKFKLAKTIAKPGTTSWKDAKAPKKKACSYRVRAYTYNASGKLIMAKASKAKRVVAKR